MEDEKEVRQPGATGTRPKKSSLKSGASSQSGNRNVRFQEFTASSPSQRALASTGRQAVATLAETRTDKTRVPHQPSGAASTVATGQKPAATHGETKANVDHVSHQVPSSEGATSSVGDGRHGSSTTDQAGAAAPASQENLTSEGALLRLASTESKDKRMDESAGSEEDRHSGSAVTGASTALAAENNQAFGNNSASGIGNAQKTSSNITSSQSGAAGGLAHMGSELETESDSAEGFRRGQDDSEGIRLARRNPTEILDTIENIQSMGETNLNVPSEYLVELLQDKLENTLRDEAISHGDQINRTMLIRMEQMEKQLVAFKCANKILLAEKADKKKQGYHSPLSGSEDSDPGITSPSSRRKKRSEAGAPHSPQGGGRSSSLKTKRDDHEIPFGSLEDLIKPKPSPSLAPKKDEYAPSAPPWSPESSDSGIGAQGGTGNSQRQPSQGTTVINNYYHQPTERSFTDHLTKHVQKPKLPPFKGDGYENYKIWKSTWDDTWAKANMPASIKFLTLLESLEGDPRNDIFGFSRDEDGYNKAMQLLESEYGGNDKKNHYAMSQIAKFGPNGSVGAGHEAKRATSIKRAAQIVSQLNQHLSKKGEQEIKAEDSPYLQFIKMKFHYTLLNSHEVFLDMGKKDNLESMEKFLMDWSKKQSARTALKEVTDSLSGASGQDKKKTEKKKGQATSFAAVANSSSQGHENSSSNACLVCSGQHPLFGCYKFKNLSHQDKIDKVKESRLCFNCLKTKSHFSSDCKDDLGSCKKCSRKHHFLLCKEYKYMPSKRSGKGRSDRSGKSDHEKKEDNPPKKSDDGPVMAFHGMSVKKKCLPENSLLILPAHVRSPNGLVRTLIMFDSGADKSFISYSLADAVSAKREPAELDLLTMAGQDKLKSDIVTIELERLDGSRTDKVSAYCIGDLNIPVVNWHRAKDRFLHLKDLPFPEIKNKDRVGIILGTDHPELQAALEKDVLGEKGAPLARKLPYGFACLGLSTPNIAPRSANGTAFMAKQVVIRPVQDRIAAVERDVQRLSSLEKLGIKFPEKRGLSKMDERMLDIARKKSRYDTKLGRYEVPVIWRRDPSEMSSGFISAKKRLAGQIRGKFKKPAYKEAYSKVIKDLLDANHYEVVEGVNPHECGQRFIPHFGVEKDSSESTPLRMVQDGKDGGDTSLNSYVSPGPKLQADLHDLLVSFRMNPVGLLGDISKMFLQVLLRSHDKQFHRILWAKDEESLEDPVVLQSTRWVFGNAQAPFAAQFAILKLVEDHGDKFPHAARVLKDCRYVDDLIVSFEDEETAMKLRKELMQLAKIGGFDIKKWISNSREVLKDVPVKDRVLKWELDDNEMNLPVSKALGVVWDAAHDLFVVYTKYSEFKDKLTKRTFLRVLAAVFDPLSFLAPFIIRGRVLLQLSWKEALDWDTVIEGDLGDRMLAWLKELPELANVKIRRSVRDKSETPLDLHAFSDASSHAYACVIYIRTQAADGQINVSLLTAKSRVAPNRAISIARLELIGLLLAAGLGSRVSELTGLGITYWTDSMNANWWAVDDEGKYGIFVQNRARAIKDLTEGSKIRHVPGTENPADLATRGMTLEELEKSDFWFCGPAFLKKPESGWPSVKVVPVENDPEVKKKKMGVLFFTRVDWQPRPEDYESLNDFKAAMVGALQERGLVSVPIPTAEDLESAEAAIFKIAQGEGFPDEVDRLSRNEPIKRDSKLIRGNPRLDDLGVMRCEGRLAGEETLSTDAQRPIILPTEHKITDFVLQEAHDRTNCAYGSNAALGFLREKFWVPRARQALNKIRRACVTCVRTFGRARGQLEAPLPRIRLPIILSAWAHVGIDFTGHFVVHKGRGQAVWKVYVCVFTCCVSRGVHLETTKSLDVEDFLMAFDNFSNRRGRPLKVVTDCGTNLVAGERVLREALEGLDRARIGEYAVNKNIDWRFNVPGEPHQGGVFESMVKSSKRALKATLKNERLTIWEFQHALISAEGLVNSRPLTYQSNAPDDFRVITPNSLMMGKTCGQLAPTSMETEPYHPRQRYRHLLHLNRAMWNRWQREIRPLLGDRHKWFRDRRNYEPGDEVIIIEKRTPRNTWIHGRVTDVNAGRDGRVRSVTVQTETGTVTKSVHSLLPMENRAEGGGEDTDNDD